MKHVGGLGFFLVGCFFVLLLVGCFMVCFFRGGVFLVFLNVKNLLIRCEE